MNISYEHIVAVKIELDPQDLVDLTSDRVFCVTKLIGDVRQEYSGADIHFEFRLSLKTGSNNV